MPIQKCSKCQEPTSTKKLSVKRVGFYTFGRNYKSIRNRTVAWLCPSCREVDPHWNLSPHRQQANPDTNPYTEVE